MPEGEGETVRATEPKHLRRAVTHNTALGHFAAAVLARHRLAAASEERARVAVCKAIRRALARIAEADPQLGALISAGVHTGRLCVYLPLQP